MCEWRGRVFGKVVLGFFFFKRFVSDFCFVGFFFNWFMLWGVIEIKWSFVGWLCCVRRAWFYLEYLLYLGLNEVSVVVEVRGVFFEVMLK